MGFGRSYEGVDSVLWYIFPIRRTTWVIGRIYMVIFHGSTLYNEL